MLPTVPTDRPVRHLARTTAAALVLALTAVLVVVTPAAADAATRWQVGPARTLEAKMVRMLNAERTDRGLRPLRRVAGVDNVAREWSEAMAADQDLRHRPSLSRPFTGNWRRLGENVGVGYYPRSLHRSFMNSTGHRRNVLGDFDSVGVGVALRGTNMWVTFNFVAGGTATASRYRSDPIAGQYAAGAHSASTPADIDGHLFESDVRWLERNGGTSNCASRRFCTDEPVRRSELAGMVARAMDLPPARERFVDVPSDHPYAAAIGALAAAGITRGCNPPTNDRFCPEGYVTRSQMASFMARAAGLRPTTERFVDVGSRNVHHRQIGAIAAAGITRGCNPPANDRFCPGDRLTRGQLSAFLARALS